MSKGKFSKVLSVVLSASLLLGSLPLFGGKAEAAVAAPTNPEIFYTTESSVFVRWTYAENKKYQVYMDGTKVYEGTNAQAMVSDLSANTDYSFDIYEVENGVQSAVTQISAKTTLETPIVGLEASQPIPGFVLIKRDQANSVPTPFSRAWPYIGETKLDWNFPDYYWHKITPGQEPVYDIWQTDTLNRTQVKKKGITVNSTVPYKTEFKLGNKTVTAASSYVRINNVLFRLIGDNTLISASNIKNSSGSDFATTWSAGSTTGSSIGASPFGTGYGLWVDKLTPEEGDALVYKEYNSTNWKTESVKVIEDSVALPSLADYVAAASIYGDSFISALPYPMYSRDTFDTGASYVYTDKNEMVPTIVKSKDSYIEYRNGVARMVVTLSEGTTFAGQGTSASPYRITGVTEVPTKLQAPANLKATTEAKSISTSWDTVPGALDYTMKVNGNLVYKGTEPNFIYTNVLPDTSYLLEVYGNKNGTDAGESSSLTVKTKEELAKLPAPINLGTNVVNKNILVVSFNPVAGADKYTIVINGEVAHTSPKDTSKMFYDMAPNTTYVVEVYASKDGVDGARATSTSTTPEAEIKLEAPGTPSVVSSEEANVKISWNATSGALLYKVFRNGVEVGSVSSPTYTDKNAVEDEAYLYTVKAFDGAKTSEASPFVLVTVTAKNEVPKAPSNPTNFRVVSDEHSVTALWDAATGAEEYQVVINGSEVYKGPNLSYTYTDLPVKTEYRVEIAALNAHGKSGTQLMTIWTKDPLKLPAAKNPRAETTHNEASISWDAVDGATNYWVKINNNFMYEGTDTFFTAKGLGSDRPYTVYIYAEANSPTGKIEGEPATLSIVTKKEPVLLGKPANLVASPKATYIKLTWNAVVGASEYIVKQGQSIVYQGPLTTFTDVDLESGSSYDYSVVASNGAVKSEEATVSATTVINPLPYPVNLRITNLEYNKVRIDWDAVEGADEYQVTRNGMVVGIPLQPWWSDDANSIEPGNTYIYKVAALKGSVLGKEAIKTVEVPTEPIQGQAPSGNLLIKANRVQHDKVGLSWNTVTGATYYEVYQDGENLVYSGQLNTITDPNVGPAEQHTYKVIAKNQWGSLDSNVIDITTPAAPQSIVITPSEPMEGTITFNYKVIEGSVMYVERNPQTKATPRGDGSYQVTYFNSATGETRDEGIMTPVNGMLKFTETGVDPNKNYHYDITAVVVKPDGTEEVVAKEEVSVTTPADGSGVTVPGTIVDPTNPGNGGGTTPPTPTTPPTTGGGNTGGSTGGSTTGGTTTQPTVEDKDSVPGTVVVPGTDDGEITVPTEPETNFSDISGNFAEAAIKKLTAAGILKGYADGTFGPSKKITRAEFAIMAKRAMNYESSGTYVQEFTDFNETAWYAEELLTALDAGVTKGFSDGTYRPNVFIPREQAAVMIANILENNNLDINFSEKIFSDDKDIIDWAKTPVYLLKTHKIVEGQYNHFYPKREITRAEAAVMIDRMLSILNK